MAAAECVREIVLQDKDTRFVNTKQHQDRLSASGRASLNLVMMIKVGIQVALNDAIFVLPLTC